ncbi:MAG: MerR family transcriptional regulator [Mogibacterium sp.]|nr:MerR family transcriptional regulator [Mogibacterium sp.]
MFTIGEFSKITGMGIHSLRYYDEIGALTPAYVDPVSNYRYYDFDQLRRVPGINMCKDAGIRLSEFSDFIDNDSIDYHRIIKESRAAIDRKIEEYRHQKDELARVEHSLSILDILHSDNNASLTIDRYPLWIMPADENTINDNEADLLVRLSSQARKKGYQISPLCFGLLRMSAHDSHRLFAFVPVIDDKSLHAEDIYYLEAGQYTVRSISHCSIPEADEAMEQAGQTGGSILLSGVLLGGSLQSNIYFAASKLG